MAVVEVGLLGRFDATNVVDADVAVITNVGQDHTDGEGDWRQAIASEKAGIIKPDSFLVLGEPDPDLPAVFLAEGPREAWAAGRRLRRRRRPAGPRRPRWSTCAPRSASLEELFLPLHGAHQADNAAVRRRRRRGLLRPAPSTTRSPRPRFAGVTMPGRFEVVGRSPLVVVDGAHNPDGAARRGRARSTEEFDVAGRRVLVVGMLGGRDPVQMLEALDVAARRPGHRLHPRQPPGHARRRGGRRVREPSAS